MIRLDTKEFIRRARLAHGDLYDYSKTRYYKCNIKSTITCKVHGDFQQTPQAHSKGNGCPKCGILRGRPKVSGEDWINACKRVHGDLYDYSKSVYTGARNHITVTCKIHGDFEIIANNHRQAAKGCQKCGRLRQAASLRRSK